MPCSRIDRAAAPDGAMASEAAVTIPSIISAVASGGVGGGVLRVLTGVVKSLLAKS